MSTHKQPSKGKKKLNKKIKNDMQIEHDVILTLHLGYSLGLWMGNWVLFQ
jgi:hypothetical protein